MRPTARIQLITAARDLVGYWDQLNDTPPDSMNVHECRVELSERVERIREALDRLR